MNLEGFTISVAGEQINCFYITDHHTAAATLKMLEEKSYSTLGLDIETGKRQQYLADPQAGLCPYRSFISLLQIYDSNTRGVYMFDLSRRGISLGLTVQEITLQLFSDLFNSRRLIAHNAIFDQSHLALNGYPNLKMDCSMIMYNVVKCAEYLDTEDEESQAQSFGEEGDGTAFDFLSEKEKYGASLSAVTSKLLGLYVPKELQASDWTSRPISEAQLIYAAKDAYFTFEIGKILSRKIVSNGLSKAYKLYRDTIHPVVAMVLNGNKIDVKLHTQNCKEWEHDIDIAHAEVIKHFGNDVKIRSSQSIAKWVTENVDAETVDSWPRTEKSNAMQMDAKTLTNYDYLPFVQPLLKYKKLEKMLSTYGPSIIDKINPATGRLHGSYTIGYTATGRLSSRNPNLQNSPHNDKFRGVFTCEDGYMLVGADYNQIEPRIAAVLSGDKVLLNAYATGQDLYKVTASGILNKPISQITPENRKLAKAIFLGLSYGLGAKGLVEYVKWNYGITITTNQSYKYCDNYFTTYHGYAEWMGKQRVAANQRGYTTTKLGKVRKLGTKRLYTVPVNHPIQGAAAEVMQIALVNLQKKISGHPNIKLIKCVHDDATLEVREKSVKEASKILKETMESAMLQLFPTATLNNLITVTTGKSWADLK